MTDDDCGDHYAVATKIDGHYFAVMFDDATRQQAYRTIARWASNPELPFTWADAARMSQQVREVV